VKLYLELQPTTTPSIVHCRYYMFMHLYTIHHQALVHWTIEQYIYNSIINTTLIPRYFHTILAFFLVFAVSIFDVSIHHLNATQKKTRRIALRCFEIASLRTCRRGFLMVVWWLMASARMNEIRYTVIDMNGHMKRYEWWQWLMVTWIMIFSEHEMLTIRWWFWGYFKMIDDNYMMNFGLRSENSWVYIIHGW
jgi:hypothetical protein